ncbi:MAG: sporulation protein [Betaproteobacteria bacterium HGW-Betaproteobacteria-20]|jgi:hypothetical protein|nr:MAG: sporulation protein [Betaproteobacteria bacterium HGW-Betaproteobacteria-20]
MKKIVWLLVFINIGLFAYFNLEHIIPGAPKATRAEINPEKINVLSPQQINALPKKSAGALTPDAVSTNAVATSTANVEASCYEWGIFSTVSLGNAQRAASNLLLQPTVKEQTSLEAKRFWVYKPPMKSAEAAQAKALELKALGVQELFVIQNSRWKNAISFGVFEDEKLASSLLNELKAKGVKDVVKALRSQGRGHASLLFNKLTDADAVALKKLKPDFPEANLKVVSCEASQ